MITIGGEGLSTAEIIIIVVAIIKLIDFIILLDCEDFSFLNPIRNYKMWKSLNWFGVAIFTFVLNIFHPLFSIGYWFYKLCTVGRKSTKEDL